MSQHILKKITYSARKKIYRKKLNNQSPANKGLLIFNDNALELHSKLSIYQKDTISVYT